MTTARPPAAGTALKEGAPPTVPLPPTTTALDAEQAARRLLRLDVVLVALTLGLAFLLASFPARNSDVWAHLAAGRALLHDGFAFGTDPFLYTTAGQTWVNHSWLYDLLSYGIYQLLGGPGLVVLKALLVVLLAEILLRTGRAGRYLWAPVVCTALALVAMSPRLALQPVCVSYLLLALTVWFLERQRRLAAVGFASYWPLLVLFALWVNLDAWFFLGPLTVALYWLGELLLPRTTAAEARRHARTLGLVLLAGVAACLLNPSHVRAFDVLPLLAPDPAVTQDPYFRRLDVSPVTEFYARPWLMRMPANLVYLALVVLGAVSFALAGIQGRAWRVALWLSFFLFSAYQAQAMPFFAVVAAPILALNLLDCAARQPAAARPDRVYRRALAGRQLTVAAGVLLLATAWQGLIQGRPLPLQRWALEPDPALTRLAEQLARWRQQGKLAAGANGFNFSAEVGDYLAWAGPEKAFADGRLPEFPALEPEYAAVWRGVEQELQRRAQREPSAPANTDLATALVDDLRRLEPESAGPKGQDWRDILRRHRVNHVILYDTNFVRLGLLNYFLTAPAEWPLLYLDGRVAVFGWLDPRRAPRPDPFAGLRFDVGAAAFHPPADKMAPAHGPGRPPEVRPWWDLLRPPPPPRPLAADEAAMYTLYFDLQVPRQRILNALDWVSCLPAGLVGLSDPRAGWQAGLLGRFAPQGVARIVLHFPRSPAAKDLSPADRLALALQGGYLQTRDDAPLGLPLLAVRAGRRAIGENPDEVNNYLMIAEAYRRLSFGTRERTWGNELRQLRLAQLVTALHNALAASPNALQAAQAHDQLVLLNLKMNYHDVALKHLKEQLRHTQAASPRRGQSARPFEQQIAAMTRSVKEFEKAVGERLAEYEENAAGLRPTDRARMALSKGLAGKALEILLASDVSVFGAEGARMQLDLMLSTGRIYDVRTLLQDDDLKGLLGASAYHWLRVQVAAALGDYAEADREFQAMQQDAGTLARTGKGSVPALADAGLLIGELLLDGLLEDKGVVGRIQAPLARASRLQRLGMLLQGFRSGADVAVLRGVLALERGETARAEGHFREALAVWGGPGRRAPSGMDFSLRPVAEDCLALIRRSSGRAR